MNKIKLLKVDVMKDDTIRLQSQLMVGKDSVDFILKNGVLKCYGRGKSGFDFYKTNVPYEIVSDKKDMIRQSI